MSRERNQSADVQHTIVSPNEAMDSYIGDLLCFGNESELEDVSEPSVTLEASAKPASVAAPAPEQLPNKRSHIDPLVSISNSIKPGFSLIPLISLDRYQLDLLHPQRSLSASFVLLLWGLHLLRMPISGRLRLTVFEYSRQRLREYRLLKEITQLPTAGGECNE